MIIDDQDLYHGAALAQIARDPRFTAINVMQLNGVPSRSAFFVNDDIGIYLKYATNPTQAFDEYAFTFSREHFDEIAQLTARRERCFAALVCVQDRQICCIGVEDLLELRKRREAAVGAPEDALTVLAVLPEGKQFRVYVNRPGRKGQMLGSPILAPRKAFPTRLFL